MAATHSSGTRRTTARETAARTTKARASSAKAGESEHPREPGDAQEAQTQARRDTSATAGAGPRSAHDGGEAGGFSPSHLDETVTDAAIALARTPVTAIRRVAPVAHGLPVYLGIGGLAVLGAVEWPVAAAAGVGFAAMRRWGPLRDDQTRGRSGDRRHAEQSA